MNATQTMLQAKSQTNVCLANVPSLRSPMAPTPPPPPKKGIRVFMYFLILLLDIGVTSVNADDQGGRTWQPFVGCKNGNENFCQARMTRCQI